ncbi:MAG: LacI family DNA-binding transcriptional regulator, partial [Pseudomonadota bacterium]
MLRLDRTRYKRLYYVILGFQNHRGHDMTETGWKRRRVTIKDIAAAAEVDPSTVTRALQNSPRVRTATLEKIQRLAREMG